MFKTVKSLLATSILGVFAKADMNGTYGDFLNGEVALTEQYLYEMFEVFVDEGDSVIDLDGEERFEIFKANVKNIVSHNSDESSTYKKGINKFSAMTHEEFVKYFSLRAD